VVTSGSEISHLWAAVLSLYVAREYSTTAMVAFVAKGVMLQQVFSNHGTMVARKSERIAMSFCCVVLR